MRPRVRTLVAREPANGFGAGLRIVMTGSVLPCRFQSILEVTGLLSHAAGTDDRSERTVRNGGHGVETAIQDPCRSGDNGP